MPIQRERFYFGMKVSSTTLRLSGGDGSEPGYLALYRSGDLARRARAADEQMERCGLCARYCGANRKANVNGPLCGVGELARVVSASPQHGEPDCLRGWRGSGVVLFGGCNLRGAFCENWNADALEQGEEVAADDLAGIMLALQAVGCHNINLANAGQAVAQILSALVIAAEGGLRLPLVFCSSGYDSPEALRLLDGVVDVYMPDMRFGDAAAAERYLRVPDYIERNRDAVREMHRQVGDLVVGADGAARRGLIVRHLLLPNNIAGTEAVMRFLAEEVSADTYVSIIDRYRPSRHAAEFPELDRPVSREEYRRAIETARRCGLHRTDGHSADSWVVRWP